MSRLQASSSYTYIYYMPVMKEIDLPDIISVWKHITEKKTKPTQERETEKERERERAILISNIQKIINCNQE